MGQRSASSVLRGGEKNKEWQRDEERSSGHFEEVQGERGNGTQREREKRVHVSESGGGELVPPVVVGWAG